MRPLKGGRIEMMDWRGVERLKRVVANGVDWWIAPLEWGRRGGLVRGGVLMMIILGGLALVGAIQQHGPEAECVRICVPAEHEDHIPPSPDGELPMVQCQGTGSDSCTAQGAKCTQDHRSGCSEHCRPQCCRCCDI